MPYKRPTYEERRQLAVAKEKALKLSTPDGYAEEKLGMSLYPKQREALQKLLPSNSRVSFASANSGGKTRICAAAAVLWHLDTFPKGIVDATSGSYRQIEDQLMPALHSFRHLYPNWKFAADPYIETHEYGRPGVSGGFFRGFSTDQPGRAEGDHAKGTEEPLLYLVDEAKSAAPWLQGVIEGRVRPTRLFIMSSHGFAEGWFYESQTTDKARYSTVNQSAEDCPHITPQEIEDVRKKWPGPFGDSILGYGFIPLVEDAIFHYRDVDWCMEYGPKPVAGDRHAFCDFAWSNDGDESILALKSGNQVTLEACFRADGLHPVCDRFVHEFIRLQLRPQDISGDNGGGGKLVMDELDRRGWILNRVDNGAPANDGERYYNQGTEIWYEGGKEITNHFVKLPNDRDLRYQLLNRKRVKDTKGRLKMESKRDMKKRGVMSPDRADACYISGTMVETDTGERPIETLKIGDLVLTPFGYSPVTQLHNPTSNELVTLKFSDGRELTGTPEHRIFVKGEGWKSLDTILLTHDIESVNDIWIWNILNSLFARAGNTGFKQQADIIKTKTGKVSPKDFFIASFGLSIMEKFLTRWKFTTKTKNGGTIESKIWNYGTESNTEVNTLKIILSGLNIGKRFRTDRKKQLLRQSLGINQMMVENGIGFMELNVRQKESPHFQNQIANIVGGNIKKLHLDAINFAQRHAGINLRSGIISQKGFALFAAINSWLTNIALPKLVPLSVERSWVSKPEQVYCITLEKENAFYANGVLTENCLGCLSPKGGGFHSGIITTAIPVQVGGYQPVGLM
jgi:phage terminase large subunit